MSIDRYFVLPPGASSCFAMCLLLAASPVYPGAAVNGDALLHNCKIYLSTVDGTAAEPKGSSAGVACEGYLRGFIDSHGMESSMTGDYLYCLPPGTSTAQVVLVVVKYLEDNPTKLHQPRAPLVARALTQAFPCKK
jgi:Ssp1 endopeptidase immunity protein Rap1a